MSEIKKYAVIVAGGSGQRMGTQVPKQFLLLRGKPVLWYAVDAFLQAYEDLEVILVLPEEHIETGKRIVYSTEAPHRIRIVAGGSTRFHSVQNGLSQIREESVVFVHDGVRCMLTRELIHRCYERAVESGSAIPVIDSRDSVRLVTAKGNEAIDRSTVKLIQTPQTFLSSLLLPAFQVEYQERFTDEATVVEAAGHSITLVEGESNNIKVTTPIDLVVAEQLLQKEPS